MPVIEAEHVVGEFIDKCGIDRSHSAKIILEIESLHGVIERLSQDHYCFSHNTFQEYFAAKRIIGMRDEISKVQDNIEKDSWGPVIEFIVALLDDPFPVLQVLVKSSNMSNLSNYPAMAKRTKTLSLLYRCMSSSPLLDASRMQVIIDHLVESHYQMARIYGTGGVFPFAMLRDEGIVHTFIFTHRRPTLAQALQPFRRLANTIQVAPLRRYAETVIQRVDIFDWKRAIEDKFGPVGGAMVCDTLAVSLLVPIASVFPSDVTYRLNKIVERAKSDFIRESVRSTVRLISTKYGI